MLCLAFLTVCCAAQLEALCNNTMGSFKCACNAGYEGTGTAGTCYGIWVPPTPTDLNHSNATSKVEAVLTLPYSAEEFEALRGALGVELAVATATGSESIFIRMVAEEAETDVPGTSALASPPPRVVRVLVRVIILSNSAVTSRPRRVCRDDTVTASMLEPNMAL